MQISVFGTDIYEYHCCKGSYPNQTPYVTPPCSISRNCTASAVRGVRCCIKTSLIRSPFKPVSDNIEHRHRVSPHARRLWSIHLSLISPSSSASATSTSCFLKSAFMRLFKVPPFPPSARPLLSLLELELLEPPPRLEVAPLLIPDS